MIGKVFLAIVALLVLSAFSPTISAGIKSWRTDDVTQTEPSVVTAGATTANVELTRDLFRDDVSEVISVSSNITESPRAFSYAANILTIDRLTDNSTRTLTIRYYADLEDNVMRALGPFLSLFIFGGIIFAIAFGVWQGRHR